MRGAELVKKRVASTTPALRLLQRRQLLRLAEQTAGAARLGAPSLVVGHDLKLSIDAAPAVRPRVVLLATFNPAEMQTTGVLSNHQNQASLAHLANRLAGLRASGARPRPVTSRRLRPHRPGWVLDAVLQVLADQAEPMRVTHVHATIEKLLGQTVSKDSVSWCLSTGVRGKKPRFERVAYGCYRLLPQT